jgi:hypothetical protein
MITGVAVGSEPPETEQEDLRDTVEILVNRGEIEVVTTPSGEILYIRQSLDD